jgi:hypothetical protein
MAAAAAVLSGCCRLRPSVLPICALAPKTPPASEEALTIDAHCHIFNGTDLQVSKFISLNASLVFDQELKDLSGALLQDLSWALAPTGCEEYKELGELAKCSGGPDLQQRLSRHRQSAFNHARSAMRETSEFRHYNTPGAKTRRNSGKVASDKPTHYRDTLGNLLDADSLADYKSRDQAIRQRAITKKSVSNPDVSLGDFYVAGLFKFVLQGFNFRYVNVQDYLDTYNSTGESAGRTIDFMVANLVDYDWPLAMGCGTKTSLRDQLDVMERLSLFTRGRVHAMVPYDPMRQVAIKSGNSPGPDLHCGSSGSKSDLTFTEIKAAVESRGFLGIKLYLPMGFVPIGNASAQAGTWQQSWLPAWMNAPVYYPSDQTTASFGNRLDDELRQLYEWAVDKEVPITAHAEASQGPSLAFDQDAVSLKWGEVLNTYKSLRINFGHTGDISSPNSAVGCILPVDAQNLIGLFGSGTCVAGDYAYADLSYAEGVLSNPASAQCRLQSVFGQPPKAGSPPVFDRLMYGTDWFMVLQEPSVEEYFADFQSMMKVIDSAMPQTPPISQRFFALNAIRWLGLEDGSPTRTRLENFYKQNDVTTPEWMVKV